MVTDWPPEDKRRLAEYWESDRLGSLELPADERLRAPAAAMEAALESDQSARVRDACVEFVTAAADFYRVPRPEVRVLAARPLRVREGGWSTELFGDYEHGKRRIRVWMRTAIRRKVTSYGTFLSTLCHEFCHHLDYERFRFGDSYHTRGFYERTAVLYHHARATPVKQLFWRALPGDRWRIDWARTKKGSA